MIRLLFRILVAAAIGASLGFLALRVGEVGWALAALLLSVMSVYYAAQGKRVELGWMLIGAGLAPGLILARNVLTAFADPAVSVYWDTWVMLGIAAGTTALGLLILGSIRSDTRGASR